MGRTEYQEILDEAEAFERCVVASLMPIAMNVRASTRKPPDALILSLLFLFVEWEGKKCPLFTFFLIPHSALPPPLSHPKKTTSFTSSHHAQHPSSSRDKHGRRPDALQKTRNRTKGGAVWDLEAEATRLDVKLDELPMDQKGWERAVNVAYRKAALRAHPDKHPPEQRDAAEANFKRLNEANKIMLRVGKAIREAGP